MQRYTTALAVALTTFSLLLLLAIPGILAAIDHRSRAQIILGVGYPWLSLGFGACATRFWQRYPLKKWQVFLAYCVGMFPLLAAVWGIQILWGIGPAAYGGMAGGYALGVALVRSLAAAGRSDSHR